MSDEITLTLPDDREFHRVAHLVLGGLALRLDLTIETLEDMQIALAALLDLVDRGSEITVAMSPGEGVLETRVAPLEVSYALDAPGEDELNLRRVLAAVVDDVQVDHDSVTLTKRVPIRG
jgi:hypothetical protein